MDLDTKFFILVIVTTLYQLKYPIQSIWTNKQSVVRKSLLFNIVQIIINVVGLILGLLSQNIIFYTRLSQLVLFAFYLMSSRKNRWINMICLSIMICFNLPFDLLFYVMSTLFSNFTIFSMNDTTQ